MITKAHIRKTETPALLTDARADRLSFAITDIMLSLDPLFAGLGYRLATSGSVNLAAVSFRHMPQPSSRLTGQAVA
ncbi:hypothetical protein SCFA_530001 [anaerobic digester metagenome]|uniref:Uncharacterized protein n=1 Tax=anaerobic digester metagenome TaxID=1263854 RepID=A0A485M207_9ZZZZ